MAMVQQFAKGGVCGVELLLGEGPRWHATGQRRIKFSEEVGYATEAWHRFNEGSDIAGEHNIQFVAE